MSLSAPLLSNEQLIGVFALSKTATAIHIGEDATIQFANDAMLSIWGKDKRVIGKSLEGALPELKGQPFVEMFRNVWLKGITISGSDTPATLNVDGKEQVFYFDFEYRAVKNEQGKTICILHTATDVTDRFLKYAAIDDANKNKQLLAREQELNEELAATNEELLQTQESLNELNNLLDEKVNKRTAELAEAVEREQAMNEELLSSNEELIASNDELAAIRETLHLKLAQLAESEEKLTIAIETGNMGTWSIDPATLKITMSDFVKDMFGLQMNTDVEMDQVMKAIRPDYHQMLFEALNNALKNGAATDTEYPITNLITGEEKWIKATGKVLTDADGNPGEYTGMFMDITERKLDEIRKNDFIGMVSHELKTPLTSLTAIIQVANIKLKNSDDVFLATALDKANMQVKKMSTMINGFLNISRLESGKIQLDKKEFDLNELAGQVIDEAKVTAPGYSIELLSADPCGVTADPDKIGSVISNLLSNAVKYSPKGKNIQLNCQILEGKVQLSIKDEGMGIKQTDIDHLFDRYYRVDNPNYSHISGFGIGLYLSAEIIHQHGGEIWVDSTPEIGSTFYFSLPLK